MAFRSGWPTPSCSAGRQSVVRLALASGVGWGLFLETFQLRSTPGWLNITTYKEFVTISFLGHIVYGLVLGALGHRWLPWAADYDDPADADEASLADRVELQRELDADRVAVFRLVATADGLRSWLDDADIEPRVGGAVRLVLRDSEVVGKVLAIDEPQHVSFTWQWSGDSTAAGVVAFDTIDHGARTHLTVRHVGLRDQRRVELHDALWRFWLARLVSVAEGLGGRQVDW